MSESYEETMAFLERVMDKLHNSSPDPVIIRHETPSHTSIRIPSEQKELEKRQKKYNESRPVI